MTRLLVSLSMFIVMHFIADARASADDPPFSITELVPQPTYRYPPEIAGAAQAMGLQYVPEETRRVTYLDVKTPLGKSLLASRLQENPDELDLLIDVARVAGLSPQNDLEFVMLAGMSYPVIASTFVVKTTKPIDVRRLAKTPGVRTEFVLGKPVFSTEITYFSFPEEKTIVIGGRNEVIYALRFKNRTKHFQRFGWLDPKGFSWVIHDSSTGAAFSNTRAVDFGFSAEAKKAADLLELEEQLKQGKITVEQFTDGYIQQYQTIGNPPPPRDQILRSAQNTQNAYSKVIPTFSKISALQDVWIRELRFESIEPPKARIFRFSPGFEPIRSTRNADALSIMQRFETRQFSSQRERETMLRDSLNAFTKLHHRMALGDTAAILPVMKLFFLTSDHASRQKMVMTFAARPTLPGLEMLGTEARYFGLLRAFSKRGVTYDTPRLKSDSGAPRYVRPNMPHTLLSACSYYLKRPGDPRTTIGIIRILEDLRPPQADSWLQTLANDPTRDASVRDEAKRAREAVLADKQLSSARLQPKDASQALDWFDAPYRPKRAGAITWAINSQLPDSQRAAFISKMSEMLDDSILCQRAVKALKQHLKPGETNSLRAILATAVNNQGSFRDDRTAYRAVDVLAHVKDHAGIQPALKSKDFKLAKYAKSVSP